MKQDNYKCISNPAYVNDKLQYGNADCWHHKSKDTTLLDGCTGLCWIDRKTEKKKMLIVIAFV